MVFLFFIDEDFLLLGDMIYSLINPKSFRLLSSNQTKLILRTQHSHHDNQYRGFNLTYQSNLN
jgi:hypothetical protein